MWLVTAARWNAFFAIAGFSIFLGVLRCLPDAVVRTANLAVPRATTDCMYVCRHAPFGSLTGSYAAPCHSVDQSQHAFTKICHV